MALSKNKIKLINALSQKKQRDAQGLFCAEGEKCVLELMKRLHCTTLVTTHDWISSHARYRTQCDELIEVESAEEIGRISSFKTPSQLFAIFRKPTDALPYPELAQQLTLLLDAVQDPGNLGTIVRLADWFGIHHVICLEQTADIYNPKAVQATMGALARVEVHYADSDSFFTELSKLTNPIPVYGTFLNGENLYTAPLTPHGIVVMGNEGKGISPRIEAHIGQRITIPNYPADAPTSESLNVAMATGIVCAEFRRRLL